MNVYCPNCETACSEAATTCPKCGHLLRRRRIWGWLFATRGVQESRYERSIYRDIGWLYILGTGVILLSLCSAAFVIGYTGRLTWETVLVTVGGLEVGLMTRATAGIWGALERIAKKS